MKSKRRIGLIGSIGALIIVSLFLFGQTHKPIILL